MTLLRLPRAEPVLFAIWAIELIGLVWSPAEMRTASGLLMIVYLALSLPRLRRGTVVLCLPLAVAAAGLAAWYGQWDGIFRGFASAAVFVAFFGSIVLLRAIADRRPEIARARTLFTGLRREETNGAFLVGAHLIGAVLVVGVMALLAPILGRDADDATRRRAAEVSQRGMCLAPLWSPFWVAAAFAAATVAATATTVAATSAAAAAVAAAAAARVSAGQLTQRGCSFASSAVASASPSLLGSLGLTVPTSPGRRVSAAASSASSASASVLRHLDAALASVDVGAVGLRDGVLRPRGFGKGDKPKPARPTRVPVRDHLAVGDLAAEPEGGAQALLVRVVAEVTDHHAIARLSGRTRRGGKAQGRGVNLFAKTAPQGDDSVD